MDRRSTDSPHSPEEGGISHDKETGTVAPNDANEKHQVDSDSPRSEFDNVSSNESTQDGVKAIEAISMTWTKRGLIAAYCGIMIMAIVNSLEGQVTISVTPFVTSSFQTHSLVSTIGVVQGVINGLFPLTLPQSLYHTR